MTNWIKVEGFPGYSVNEEGQVRNDRRGRVLTPRLHEKGYQRYALYKDGRAFNVRAHVVVATAHVPNPDNLPEVNHLDEDKTNNHKNNLAWSTRQENVEYSSAHAYGFISPDGKEHRFFNLCKFCLENGLAQSAMQHVTTGKRQHHKGWTKA